jgi:transcriptional regulator with XRE-family HTH domain
MKSSSLHIDRRRRSYVRLLGEIQHALNQALSEEHQRRGLTRAEMARIIGKNKSFVTRKLTGVDNMTLETFADLAFALDRPVRVSLLSGHDAGNHNLSGEPQSQQVAPSGIRELPGAAQQAA